MNCCWRSRRSQWLETSRFEPKGTLSRSFTLCSGLEGADQAIVGHLLFGIDRFIEATFIIGTASVAWLGDYYLSEPPQRLSLVRTGRVHTSWLIGDEVFF